MNEDWSPCEYLLIKLLTSVQPDGCKLWRRKFLNPATTRAPYTLIAENEELIQLVLALPI
jgi:hypothetical protein